MKVSIIGAGISGLSSAYYLDKLARQSGQSIEINVFERSRNTGGSISTVKTNGLIFEEGADSFITSKPWALDLCREIGLEDKLIFPKENNRSTYVYLNKTPKKLPDGFFLLAPSDLDSFSRSGFFTDSEKERILTEQTVPVKDSLTDESIDDFVIRRFGRELLEKVVKPLIGGIYTGDTNKLSAEAVLPEFVSMEREFGSVIKGIEQKKLTSSNVSSGESGARYGLFLSLDEGISSLVDGLIDAVQDVNIQFDCEITSVYREKECWILEDKDGKKYSSEGVIVAAPANVASKILLRTDPGLSEKLGQIEFASSLVGVFAVRSEYLVNVPECFGIVVPPSENMNILACSFSSRKFPGRGKDGLEVIRCFAGGALNADIMNKSNDEIKQLLLNEMKVIFKADIKPELIGLKKYFNAMPQYNIGHTSLIKEIFSKTGGLSALSLAGNAYGGVGIPDCIKSGMTAAANILDQLK